MRDEYFEQGAGKDESDAMSSAIFGKSRPDTAVGEVIFFNAVPVEPGSSQHDLDMRNPHCSDYKFDQTDRVGRPNPPVDYLSPVAVFFVTTELDRQYLFPVASKKALFARQAHTQLQAELRQVCFDTKTTAGYEYSMD